MHYHFKKGGVTDVIAAAVKAFDVHKTVAHVTLACGDICEKAHGIISSIGTLENVFIESQQVPLLGYWDINSNVKPYASEQAVLKNFFAAHTNEETLWWVHNHHLGKNPFFTKMLMEHLSTSGQRCILHMHDFPEAARFANLSALQNVMSLSACYAAIPGTQYAVINSVDACMLRNGGLSAHYIPNIIRQNRYTNNPTKCAEQENINAHALLHEISPHTAHDPKRALLFTYPVRCIRRKNALEAALITKLYEVHAQVPCNYNITLPGESEQEKGYSDIVRSLFEERVVHGFFGLGKYPQNTLSLTAICEASNVIVSSSVQEGFGFSYLGAAAWGRPLLARRIAMAEDSAAILTSWDAHWYNELCIPRALLSSMELSHLHNAYQKKIKAAMKFYTTQQLHMLERELHTMIMAPEIDFSFLGVATQVRLIRDFAAYCSVLLTANTKLMNALTMLVQNKNDYAAKRKKMQSVAEGIETRFGEETFLRAFTEAAKATQCSHMKHNAHAVSQNTLETHAHMSCFRLLLSSVTESAG